MKGDYKQTICQRDGSRARGLSEGVEFGLSREEEGEDGNGRWAVYLCGQNQPVGGQFLGCIRPICVLQSSTKADQERQRVNRDCAITRGSA